MWGKKGEIILLLSSLIFSILVIEIYLRLDDHSQYGQKDHKYRFNGREYRLNEQPTAFAGKHPAVIFLGDSFTKGSKCGVEMSLPGQFRALLNHSAAADHKVLNLGVAGTGPFSYATRLGDYIKEHGQPALVLVILYSNDIVFESEMCKYSSELMASNRLTSVEREFVGQFCTTYKSAPVGSPPEDQSVRDSLNRYFYHHSHVYRLLREVAANLADAILKRGSIGLRTYPPAFPPEWNDTNGLRFKLVEFALKQIKTRTEGSKLVIAFYPNVEDLSYRSPLYQPYQKASLFLSHSLGVPVFNGYGAFLSTKKAKGDMRWSLTDGHPSCEAHGIFAEWILRRVEASVGTDI